MTSSGEIFYKCSNNSEVIATSYAGGILGEAWIASVKFCNCMCGVNSNITATKIAGGLFGAKTNYGSIYTYNSCVLGKISGPNINGGIYGTVWSRSSDSYIASTIENSYFGGTIEGGKNVGGIIGYNNCDSLKKISFVNCYYINTINKTISNVEENDLTGVTALSEEDMRVNSKLLEYLQGYTNNEIELLPWIKETNQYPTFSN